MCIFFLFQSVFIFSLNLNTWSQVYAFTLTLLPCSSAAMQLQSNERFQLHIIMCEQFFYVQIWSWTVQKWHTSEASLSLRVNMQCGFFVHKVAHAAANETNRVGSLHCHKLAHTCTRSVFLWTNLDFHLQSKPLALWDNKKIATKRMTIRHYMEKKQWVYSRILLDRITHVHIIQWAQLHAC